MRKRALGWALTLGLPLSALAGATEEAPGPAPDRVARLADDLATGAVALASSESHGYLPALLQHLDVPVSSQVLVFSKTSLQIDAISPQTPRAVYFGDDVYLGWVPGGALIEISAVDSRGQTAFYSFDRRAAELNPERAGRCTQCHDSGRTLNVPGHLVRSVHPDREGNVLLHLGSFLTDHRSPLPERWGGWYVTGTHGAARHMGNAVVEDEAEGLDFERGANCTDLSAYFATDSYLSPHSDLVALMVLEHQTRIHNLIAWAGHETEEALRYQTAVNRMLGLPESAPNESAGRRLAAAAEELLRGLLLSEEARLEEKVRGTSTFAADFAARGPRDSRGRSLRELHLRRRLFKYPCSYLIYSEAFLGLPETLRSRIYRDLEAALAGADPSGDFDHLTSAARRAIFAILRDTHPELGPRLTAAEARR